MATKTPYLGDMRLYLDSIKDESSLFIYYSSRYNAFFDEFGAVIVNIFYYLHPWQVEIFLDRLEYMYFYNGPNGPIEVDYVEGIENIDLELGTGEYFERR